MSIPELEDSPRQRANFRSRVPRRSSHASKLALTSAVISNWTGRPVFLLDNHGTGSDLLARDEGCDLDLNEISAS